MACAAEKVSGMFQYYVKVIPTKYQVMRWLIVAFFSSDLPMTWLLFARVLPNLALASCVWLYRFFL